MDKFSNLMQLSNYPIMRGGPMMPQFGGNVTPQPIYGGGDGGSQGGWPGVQPVGPQPPTDPNQGGFPPVGPVGPQPPYGGGGYPPVGPVGPQPPYGGGCPPVGPVGPQPPYGGSGYPPIRPVGPQQWGSGMQNLALMHMLSQGNQGFGGY